MLMLTHIAKKTTYRLSAWLMVCLWTFLSAASAHAEGVLVFGGTGRLGAEIVKELAKAGEQVVVFARPGSDRYRLRDVDVGYVIGDALRDQDVEAAFNSQRFRIAVNALSSRGNDDVTSFYAESQKLITKWAMATGVKRIILHSSVGVAESRTNFPEEMLLSREATIRDKEVAESELTTSGADYTIIRNFRLRYQPLDPKFHDTGYLTEDITVFGGIRRLDLARFTLSCLDDPKCENKIFHAQDDGPMPPPAR